MKKISKTITALLFILASLFLPFSQLAYATQANATVNWTVEEGGFADLWINNTMVMPAAGENPYPTNVAYETETTDTTVTFRFETLYIEVINSLSINGHDFSNQLPKTSAELGAHYANQHISFEVEVDKSANYNIVTKSDFITGNQQFMGNFLWENDENDVHAVPDDIIGKGTLEFVKATYDGVTYNSITDLNQNCQPSFCHWEDSIVTEEDQDGSTGGAELPIGTELTVRLIPESGYQLVSFGINGGEFEPQENIGEYTFTIRGGNAHLAADFEPVDDVVDASASKAINSGSISLGGEESSMEIGTARLDVSDVELSDEQISNFQSAAPSGYNVVNYADISLYNTVFKGSDSDSWDTQVTELDHTATITLQLEDGIDGSNLVVIHEKHDGTYEVIETTYDRENNTISFQTDSFSNYALATKTITAPNSGLNNASGSVSAISSNATSLITFTAISAMLWFTLRRIHQ
ncbi:hypothetical protein IJG78_00590 [Candidatus Saccharibacteria bacterium]|nr:hypothetical protein [Candidatus Saccharibacteria bacterium]